MSGNGAAVFGNNAFSEAMTTFLASVDKTPADLRFAQAFDPSDTLQSLEAGVFQVADVDAATLAEAIVDSSRPGAPDLGLTSDTISGKPVTILLNPSGSTLYLYEHSGVVGGDVVFYVGTTDPDLAATVLDLYP